MRGHQARLLQRERHSVLSLGVTLDLDEEAVLVLGRGLETTLAFD